MIEHLLKVIERAGRKIMKIYKRMDVGEVITKGDGSPLTEADLASHNYIVSHLPGDYPILSEENKEEILYDKRKNWKRYWCIDPLDGTKDFLQKNDEFVINIALIEDGKPVLGLVHVPVKKITYVAERGGGAYIYKDGLFESISVADIFGVVKVVMSRNHCNEETYDLIDKISTLHDDKVIMPLKVGSALKFVMIADGSAHYYPRMVPTMEWDTAAPQIIVEEAGGHLISMDTMEPLTYNKESLVNPFIWTGIDMVPINH